MNECRNDLQMCASIRGIVVDSLEQRNSFGGGGQAAKRKKVKSKCAGKGNRAHLPLESPSSLRRSLSSSR